MRVGSVKMTELDACAIKCNRYAEVIQLDNHISDNKKTNLKIKYRNIYWNPTGDNIHYLSAAIR